MQHYASWMRPAFCRKCNVARLESSLNIDADRVPQGPSQNKSPSPDWSSQKGSFSGFLGLPRTVFPLSKTHICPWVCHIKSEYSIIGLNPISSTFQLFAFAFSEWKQLQTFDFLTNPWACRDEFLTCEEFHPFCIDLHLAVCFMLLNEKKRRRKKK